MDNPALAARLAVEKNMKETKRRRKTVNPGKVIEDVFEEHQILEVKPGHVQMRSRALRCFLYLAPVSFHMRWTMRRTQPDPALQPSCQMYLLHLVQLCLQLLGSAPHVKRSSGAKCHHCHASPAAFVQPSS